MCEYFTLSILIRIVLLFAAGYLGKMYLNTYVFNSRPPVEIAPKSNIQKVYYNGADYKELSAKTRRMMEIYSQLAVYFPPEIKVLV
jgi:hypothetical protein